MQPLKIILSGPFCTGKTTLLQRLRNDPELSIPTLVADATRDRRPHEEEGKPYHFISRDQFNKRNQNNEYFYTVQFNGHSYAAKHEDVKKTRWAIDIVAARWPEFKGLQGAISIYMKPPAMDVLISRAKLRGENEEAIQRRIGVTLLDDPSAASFMYQVDSARPLDVVYAKVKRIVNKHMMRVLGVGIPSLDLLFEVESQFLRDHNIRLGGVTIPPKKEEFKAILAAAATIGKPCIKPGGSTGNTMYGLSKFYQPADMSGRIGTDPLGELYLETMSNIGLNVRAVTSQQDTQQIAVMITPDQQRSFVAHLGASEEFCKEDLPSNLFAGVKLVHVEGYLLYNKDETLLEHAFIRAKEAGALITLNLCDAYKVGENRKLLTELISKYVDIVFANQTEANALTELPPEQACKTIAQMNGKVAVVTMGENGCYVATKDRSFLSHGLPTEVVDTTGASDLFASAFIYLYLHGQSLEVCAEGGNDIGSECVRVLGTDLPDATWNRLRQKFFRHLDNYEG